MTDQQPNIGREPAEGAERDAIHIAVAPCVAGIFLEPGEVVGLDHRGRAGGWRPAIGVVDPFRKEAVHEGERFWLFLYPGTITGLRHAWEHPAMDSPRPERDINDPEQGPPGVEDDDDCFSCWERDQETGAWFRN